jgi:endonuclease YncB( thermonuclease family)
MIHLLLVTVALLLPLVTAADTLTGRVVRVVDGDTVYVLDPTKTQHKIRLAGIDAPERGQPFGTRSKQRMADLVAGKDVEVDWYKEDRWGRLIGKVWAATPECRDEPCPKTLDAGLALITPGLA